MLCGGVAVDRNQIGKVQCCSFMLYASQGPTERSLFRGTFRGRFRYF